MPYWGARLRGRTATQRSKKGSEKGSGKGSGWEPKMQRKKMRRKKWCQTVSRNNPSKYCQNTGNSHRPFYKTVVFRNCFELILSFSLRFLFPIWGRVLRRVLRRGPAVGFTVKKGSEKGSQKGFWEGGFQKVPRTPPWRVCPLRRAPYIPGPLSLVYLVLAGGLDGYPCANSSSPDFPEISGDLVEFGRDRENSGNLGKPPENTVEFSGVCMALNMNSVRIPGGFRRNARFSGKIWGRGGFGRFGVSKGFCANSQVHGWISLRSLSFFPCVFSLTENQMQRHSVFANASLINSK